MKGEKIPEFEKIKQPVAQHIQVKQEERKKYSRVTAGVRGRWAQEARKQLRLLRPKKFSNDK